jgi:threonine dehydrogenase-like Zn-dependent dehydrogenase
VFGAQFAKAVGARVIGTTSSAEKAEKYKTVVGVDEVVNYRETPEWSEEVLKLTAGKGVEHVLEVGALSPSVLLRIQLMWACDMIGGQTTLGQSLKSTQVGGHIHILGIVGGINDSAINFGELSYAMIVGRLNVSQIHK